MKNAMFVLIGIGGILFLYLAYSSIKTFFLKDESIDADDVFNEYLSERINQVQNLENQNGIIADYIQNLTNSKITIDSMKLRKIDLSTTHDTIGSLRSAGNEILSADYGIRPLIFFDSSTNQTASKAYSRIKSSLFNEFSTYERLAYLYNQPFQNLNDFVAEFNNEKAFINHKQSVSNVISQQINMLTSTIASYKKLSDSVKNKITQVKSTEKLATENSRDKLLITMVIPIFAIILSIIIFVPYFLRNEKEMFNKILDDKILLQVFTIFILVISVLLLGIGGKLNGETLGTLLGGISVYVLQKSLDGKPNN